MLHYSSFMLCHSSCMVEGLVSYLPNVCIIKGLGLIYTTRRKIGPLKYIHFSCICVHTTFKMHLTASGVKNPLVGTIPMGVAPF